MKIPHESMRTRFCRWNPRGTYPVRWYHETRRIWLNNISAGVFPALPPRSVQNLDRHELRWSRQVVVDDRSVGRILANRLFRRKRRVSGLLQGKTIRRFRPIKCYARHARELTQCAHVVENPE